MPYLILATAPLCWAGNIVLARGVIDLIPPVSLAFWRWATAFAILLPFTWKYARNDWKTALFHWKIILLLSIFGITCFNTLLYMAVHTITAINGALVQTTMPAVIIIICMILYKERVSKLQIAGVGICILGAALVVLRGDLRALVNMTFFEGDVLMIIAVVLYALYSALLRKRPDKMHPLSFLTYTFGTGVFCLSPFYVWELSVTEPFIPTPDVILSILYVAMFPSIVAYLCWNRGIELIGPNRAGLFINLIPVFASVLAVFWLGETLKTYHIAGMMLILSGMIMFNRK